ncbi:MAG: arginine repressor [Clostridia bacterium]|nr:arginine repressor [Clostridia bacterium]
MNKAQRHSLILELVNRGEIGTQEALVAALEKRGVQVTQATISRDIRELHLTKAQFAGGSYRYVTSVGDERSLSDRLRRMLKESMLSVASSGPLVVIKTLSGSANVAAEALDTLAWPEVLGTLAGDNTVLVVVRDTDAPAVLERLEAFMA